VRCFIVQQRRNAHAFARDISATLFSLEEAHPMIHRMQHTAYLTGGRQLRICHVRAG
jgi:hypothetical protein